MKISMLMATLNRHDFMLRAVRSVLNQTYQDFEIVIIDQSDVETPDIEELDCRIKYFHITVKGLSHARNIGLSYVTGDIVGLMDDDAVYSENVLSDINDLFEKDSKVGLVSGSVVDEKTMQISLRGMSNKRQLIVSKNIFQCCISPSMFIKKEILVDEFFDEQFGIGNFWGSAEETDIALKVLYHKYTAMFCPDIVIYHPSCAKKDLSFNKLESYSRGFGAICAKHYYIYGNKIMRYLYKRAIVRALGGYLLSSLKFSSHMRRFYKISFKAKKEGYKTYKQKMRGDA